MMVCVLLLSCNKESDTNNYVFTEFTWGSNTHDEPLCPDAPVDPSDTTALIQLNCTIEGDSFATDPVAAKQDLLLFEYNIETGHDAQNIIDLLVSKSELEIPDIIFLSEVDRGCASSYGGQNFARVLADSLHMYYVYGAEFYEVGGDCEIGNAILSKYPLGNVEYHRFAAASTHYIYTDTGINYRQGGRSYISADVKIGDQYIRVYSTHLASYLLDTEVRQAQADELAEHTDDFNGTILVGGDFNSYYYSIYLQTGNENKGIAQPFLDRGFEDTHTSLSFDDRVTNIDVLHLVIDLFFVKGATYSDPHVGNTPAWDGLSDHSPIWATVHLE